MKNIMLTTVICMGSLVMTGVLLNNRPECKMSNAVLKENISAPAVAAEQTKVQYASNVVMHNHSNTVSYLSFETAMSNLQNDRENADEEINEDFSIDNLPVLNSTSDSDEAMNDLFESENASVKLSPEFAASDAEIDFQFHSDNK